MLTWLQKRAAKYTGRSKKEVGGFLEKDGDCNFIIKDAEGKKHTKA